MASNAMAFAGRGAVLAAALAVVLVGAMVPLGPAGAQEASEGFEETSDGFVVPDDELFQQQWGLFSYGQNIGGQVDAEPDVDIWVPEAWAITRGSADVVVAVIDSGYDLTHPDLVDATWRNPGETGDGRETNGVDDDGNGYVDDFQGWDFTGDDNDPTGFRSSGGEAGAPFEHGTGVAGLIGATGGDGTGVTGVAPGVQLMPLRTATFSEGEVREAIEYAAANGAQIVNMSFGSPGVLGAGSYEDLVATLDDVLFVAGAGNSGVDVDNPIGFVPCTFEIEQMLCTAATDWTGGLWETELSGNSSNYGLNVDVAAPGAGILMAQPPLSAIYSETFDNGLDGWEITATQGRRRYDPDSGEFEIDPGEGEWVIDATEGRDGGPGAVVRGWSGETTISMRPVDAPAAPDEVACSLSLWINADGMTNTNRVVVEERPAGSERWGFGVGGILVSGNSNAGDGWQQWTVPFGRHGPDTEWRISLEAPTENNASPDGIARVDDVEVLCQQGDYSDPDNSYSYGAGTSFAAPIVSGIAALVLSEYPDLSPVQVKEAILEGVDMDPRLDGKVRTGGRVNAYRALLAAAQLQPDSAAGSTDSDGDDEGATGASSPNGEQLDAWGIPWPIDFPCISRPCAPGDGGVGAESVVDTEDGTGVDVGVGEDSADESESAAGAADEGESGEGGLADWQLQALIAAALAGAAVMGWTWWQQHATPEQYQQIQDAVSTYEAQQEFDAMSNDIEEQLTDEVQSEASDIKYKEVTEAYEEAYGEDDETQVDDGNDTADLDDIKNAAIDLGKKTKWKGYFEVGEYYENVHEEMSETAQEQQSEYDEAMDQFAEEQDIPDDVDPDLAQLHIQQNTDAYGTNQAPRTIRKVVKDFWDALWH